MERMVVLDGVRCFLDVLFLCGEVFLAGGSKGVEEYRFHLKLRYTGEERKPLWRQNSANAFKI
jgi:hypothetical protein